MTLLRTTILFLCLTIVGTAAPIEPQTKVTKVMVIQPEVTVKNRDGRKMPVSLGQILETTVRKKDWVWVPRLRGWAPTKDTIDLKDAVAYFTAAINNKRTSQAYHHRALAWVALERRSKALTDFDEAIRIKPNAALHINRGNTYRDMENEDAAVRDYNKALQLEPRSYLALNNRGLILSSQAKYDQARLDFDAALRLKPDFAEALNHRGVVKWKQNKPEEATKDYEAALKLERGLAEPYYNLGLIAQAEENDSKAIELYEKAIELDRSFVPANNDLAWLLATTPDESLRNPEKALKYATRACALTKMKKANMIDTLSAALAADGQYDEAIRRIDQAIRIGDKEARPNMEVRKKLYLTKVPYIDRN